MGLEAGGNALGRSLEGPWLDPGISRGSLGLKPKNRPNQDHKMVMVPGRYDEELNKKHSNINLLRRDLLIGKKGSQRHAVEQEI